jgi:hypothetical protein
VHLSIESRYLGNWLMCNTYQESLDARCDNLLLPGLGGDKVSENTPVVTLGTTTCKQVAIRQVRDCLKRVLVIADFRYSLAVEHSGHRFTPFFPCGLTTYFSTLLLMELIRKQLCSYKEISRLQYSICSWYNEEEGYTLALVQGPQASYATSLMSREPNLKNRDEYPTTHLLGKASTRGLEEVNKPSRG